MSEENPTMAQKLSNVASTTASNAYSSVSNAYSSASEGISGIRNNVSSTMSEYSSPESIGQAGTDFLQSNSIIARIAFILFVIILFTVLLRLGMFLLNYFSKTKSNPYLIYGLIDGGRATQVTQDPTNENSVTILRSNNKNSGIEYTWSVWLFFHQVGTPSNGNESTTITTNNSNFQHIFHKGTNNYATDGTSMLHNGPGVYLSRNANPTIRIVVDTVDEGLATNIDIDNIPLKKWFHLLVRMKNNSVDVYINGTISAHTILDNVPKQTYYDVFICDNIPNHIITI